MDIHTGTLVKHPENEIFLYGGGSCRQKAVPFSHNPAVYKKNVAGFEQLKGATLGETSGETNSKKNHTGNQRVKCQVRQVLPIFWLS